MDKKLNEKLLDAGIIPKDAVKQMEQWQSVPHGSSSKVGKFAPEKIAALREDLEIRGLPTLRETILDVDKLMANGREVSLSHSGLSVGGLRAGVDVLNRYIFEIPRDQQMYETVSIMMRPLTRLIDDTFEEPRNNRTITEVSVLYATVEENESVPTHWFCSTEARGEETILKAR